MSTLQDKGVPMPVEQTLIAPPRCRMGSITDAERAQVRAGSPVGAKYDNADRPRIGRRKCWPARRTDRDARKRRGAARAQDRARSDDRQEGGFGQSVKDAVFGTKRRQGMVETMAKQTARTVGSQVGRQILRGVLGGIFGGKR